MRNDRKNTPNYPWFLYENNPIKYSRTEILVQIISPLALVKGLALCQFECLKRKLEDERMDFIINDEVMASYRSLVNQKALPKEVFISMVREQLEQATEQIGLSLVIPSAFTKADYKTLCFYFDAEVDNNKVVITLRSVFAHTECQIVSPSPKTHAIQIPITA